MQCAEPVTGSSGTPCRGREEARDEVGVAARGGDENRERVEGGQEGQVGLEVADLVLGLVDRHEVAGGPDLLGTRARGPLEEPP